MFVYFVCVCVLCVKCNMPQTVVPSDRVYTYTFEHTSHAYINTHASSGYHYRSCVYIYLCVYIYM
jgi:hypothetical protein